MRVEALLHPLDTLRTRLQLSPPPSPPLLYAGLYRGLGVALVGGVPAGAAFFAAKDFARELLLQHGSDPRAATLLAVCFANLPYWIIRCPAELVKTRQQAADQSSDALAELRSAYRLRGLGGVYGSFFANVVYAVPADAVKFITCIRP